MERQYDEIPSRMVTNAIDTQSGKILGNGMELYDNSGERENNKQTNVKRKSSNNDKFSPSEVIVEA